MRRNWVELSHELHEWIAPGNQPRRKSILQHVSIGFCRAPNGLDDHADTPKKLVSFGCCLAEERNLDSQLARLTGLNIATKARHHGSQTSLCPFWPSCGQDQLTRLSVV